MWGNNVITRRKLVNLKPILLILFDRWDFLQIKRMSQCHPRCCKFTVPCGYWFREVFYCFINSEDLQIQRIKILFQDGIEGKCKALYSYRKFPYDLRTRENLAENMFLVIKERDLEDCVTKPWFYHALFHLEKCKESVRMTK